MAESQSTAERRRASDNTLLEGLWSVADRIERMERQFAARMDKLEVTVTTQIAVMREEHKQLAEKLTDPKSGLITPMLVDVALLKQSEDRRNWFTRSALGAAIGAVILALWGLMTGKN